MNKYWNKCDECGKFIAIDDFLSKASRKLLTPDSFFSKETYETLCSRCNHDNNIRYSEKEEK